MKRLTKRDEDGTAYYPECIERCSGTGNSEKCSECEQERKICEKLAAYEDSGLEPEQVQKLAEWYEGKLKEWRGRVGEKEMV